MRIEEFFEEGVGSDSKYHASRGAPLDNPRQDKIKEALIALGRINSIVMKEQSVKKLAKALGKTILPKDKQDSGMLNTRESSEEVPQGKN